MNRRLEGKFSNLAFKVMLKSSAVGIMSGGRPTVTIKVVTNILVDTTVGLANVPATTIGSVQMTKIILCQVRIQSQTAIAGIMEVAHQGTQRKLETVMALQECGIIKAVAI